MTRIGRQRLFAVLLALAAGAAYGLLALLRYRRFTISSWDHAIFEQAVKGYARPGAPIVDVKGPGYNILGDHFSPIDALIAPVYRLFPAAQTIALTQVVLIAISVAVIAALAMRKLGTWTGATIGTAYALSFGLQSAVEAEFHEVAFAAPLLALAGAAYVDRRFGAVVAWSLPLLLVKEDLGLTVAAVGFVLWLVGQRRHGLVLGFVGLVAVAVTVLVIIPVFAAGDSYAYASTLGGDRGLWVTLLDSPGRKLATVALTLAITGFAALASPWVLLVIPTFVWRFAGDNGYYWGTEWHYSLVLMPIVFVAMIDAMRRWPALRWATVVAVVVTAFTLVGSPLAALLESKTYAEAPRVGSARAAIAQVPKGATVETDIAMMSHLVTDHTVYWYGSIGDATPEYVLFDAAAGIGSPEDVVAYAERTHGGRYELVYDRDGYLLAHRQR
ncbi:DUF2079 domain-containing protein [Aeromicrobium sp.]|uniref:DUF2079 domain-containing protein n=1 Tax=Aeromicrobium sp. TaxID=1871063 RepID=UPI003C527E87